MKGKRTKQAQLQPPVFRDGEKIPATLLGELRAANAELHAARQDCLQHNEAGKVKERRYQQAEHVFNFFHARAVTKFKIGDVDGLDLERGIVLRGRVEE